MLALWNHWSQQSSKWKPGECRNKWATFNANRGNVVTLGSLLHAIRSNNCNPDAPERPIVLCVPLALADHFLDVHYRGDDGRPLLRRWRGDFYAFTGSCYRVVPGEELDAQIYRHLEGLRTTTSGDVVPIVPRSALVREVSLALPSRTSVLLPNENEAPHWLDEHTGPDPVHLVPCRNGLLELPMRTLRPTTPQLFALNALSFDYDPAVPEPDRWHHFLNELWPDDPAAQFTLQRWAGYCLSADTRQQKGLLVVGPKRSGKGTIGRVLAALLGQDNICAPTMGSLATNFGLAALLGKSLAIISDARLSGRSDQAVVVERILSTTGEDHLTVDRKYREPVTCRLPTRFLILTNELPQVKDASGAFASRFIVLQLTESFLGREDPRLTDRLLDELPAILNWAVEGWHDLHHRGHFDQPESGVETADHLEDLASPINAFVHDCCVIGPGQQVSSGRLFDRWKIWCDQQGRYSSSRQVFGRDLRAALPQVRDERPRAEGGRVRMYQGVGLV